MHDPAPSVVRNPADLLTVIPYLLGYHPRECVVVMFVNDAGRLTHGLSVDRKAPEAFIVDASNRAASRADASLAFVVGYGPHADRERLHAVAGSLNRAIPIQACLLVDDNRYYLLDSECSWTPEHGTVLDSSSNVFAAEMTLRGRVALPSREQFDTIVEPDGDAQARTAHALSNVPDLLPDPVTVVQTILDMAAAGNQLTDDQAAYLARALTDNDGCSKAWQATTGETWQHNLWLDMTRRVPAHCVAAPANLLAWNAWRRNEPALAWAALTKAVQALPDNTMSNLIGIVLAAGINPATLPWPLPEDTDLRGLIE